MENAQELYLWMNGEWIPESDAKISIFDSSFQNGDAAFDLARTFNGKPFQLEEHVDRLLVSCRYLQIEPPLLRHQLITVGYEVAERNSRQLDVFGDYWVNFSITRGVHRIGYSGKPSLMIYCDPLPFKERAPLYRDGIAISISSVRRTSPSSISPRIKAHNYLNLVIAEQLADRARGEWPILLDERGFLAEGASSNIFIVKGGVILTPTDQYILPGMSRKNVLGLARDLNIPAQETDLQVDDLLLADEVFLTSTSLCIGSVSRINGKPLRDPVPGPITSQLLTAYNDLVGTDIRKQYLSFLE